MGYMHIENLERNRDILLLRECYALEKIHGTSAHVGCDGVRMGQDARKAVGRATALMFKKFLKDQLEKPLGDDRAEGGFAA